MPARRLSMRKIREVLRLKLGPYQRCPQDPPSCTIVLSYDDIRKKPRLVLLTYSILSATEALPSGERAQRRVEQASACPSYLLVDSSLSDCCSRGHQA